MKLLKMVYEPISGEKLGDCMVKALEECVKHGVNIEFFHNNRLFRASFEKCMDAVDEVPVIGSPDLLKEATKT